MNHTALITAFIFFYICMIGVSISGVRNLYPIYLKSEGEDETDVEDYSIIFGLFWPVFWPLSISFVSSQYLFRHISNRIKEKRERQKEEDLLLKEFEELEKEEKKKIYKQTRTTNQKTKKRVANKNTRVAALDLESKAYESMENIIERMEDWSRKSRGSK